MIQQRGGQGSRDIKSWVGFLKSAEEGGIGDQPQRHSKNNPRFELPCLLR